MLHLRTKLGEPLVTTIVSTINDIQEQDWNRLFPQDTIEGFGYHKTIEQAQMKDFTLFYLVFSRGKRTVGIIPFFSMDFSFTSMIQGPLQTCIQSLQKIYPRFLTLKLLFVGLPTAEELYIGIDPQEDPPMILNRGLDILSSFMQTHKLSGMVFYNLTAGHQDIADHLTKQGFIRMQSFPNTCIEVNASSWEDYVKTLGPNTRKDVRRKLRRSALLGNLSTEVCEDITPIIDEIYALYLNNLNNGSVRFESLTPDFFTQISSNLPGKVKYFITRHHDTIVAFNLCLVHKDTCIDKFIGFHKETALSHHLYFVTFSHNIQWCIDNNIRFYQMGVTDYDAKFRLGAKLLPLDVYIKFLNPLMQSMTGILSKTLNPYQSDPVLKKLKDTPQKIPLPTQVQNKELLTIKQ